MLVVQFQMRSGEGVKAQVHGHSKDPALANACAFCYTQNENNSD